MTYEQNLKAILDTHLPAIKDEIKDSIIDSILRLKITGRWVKYGVPRCGEQHYKCTVCDDYINFGVYSDYYLKAFKYCPNCGVKMEEK